MTIKFAIYAAPFPLVREGPGHIALKALRGLVETLIVVVPKRPDDRAILQFDDVAIDEVVTLEIETASISTCFRAGLMHLWQNGPVEGAVLMTGNHVLGPFLPLDPRAMDIENAGAAMFAGYWHNAAIDPRLKSATKLKQLPILDFVVFSPKLMAAKDFRSFWEDTRNAADDWSGFLNVTVKLAEVLDAGKHQVIYPLDFALLETAEPRIAEVHKLVLHGAPCIPLLVFNLDPVLYDLYSIDLRIAVDALRHAQPDLYNAAIRHIMRNVPPRDFAMAADQYEVISETAVHPEKTEWSFGRIAVFIHAFYAEMMPEFWELMQRIPCAFDVYISTSTPEHQAQIEAFLAARGFPEDATFVVVVAQNRGRDMSSLFITFRAAVLSKKYEVALRLHSKRTPQVSRQVGESFKKHLFDNLVKSRGYVANVLDRLEAEPDLGMIMPPVVQIGFGTLGHGWFINRQPLQNLANDMGLSVRLDEDTPVAPYGTMYWFRTDALREMFKWKWRWEDYNLEPNHIDGGLAHVQERLICYCCVDRGYRVLMAMTPELAARGYAKLEYKLQLLASRLDTGNIRLQRDQLDQIHGTMRSRLLRRMLEFYGAILRRFPGMRGPLQPFVRAMRFVMLPSRR